jgi:hypothetical protein
MAVYYNKYAMLERLCKEYGLYTSMQPYSYGYIYIKSHQDFMYYIEKLSPDQLEAMSPEQIESFVVECSLTDIAS